MEHIIGATFDQVLTYKDSNGTPIDITNIDIQCQLRTVDKTLLANVVVTKLDPAAGSYRMVVADTNSWAEGDAVFDIRYAQAGNVAITNKVKVTLVDSITKPV